MVDKVSATDIASSIGMALNISTEQVGLKAGMLVTAIFPIIGVAVVLVIMRYFKESSRV